MPRVLIHLVLLFSLTSSISLFCQNSDYIHCSTTGKTVKLPTIVSRAKWGARDPKSDISKYLGTHRYNRVILHNTAMGAGYGIAEAKKIQDYEMDQMNFSDMGYNFLIDSKGTIYEGRELSYVPSHAGQTKEANDRHDITLDPDYGSIGIAFSADSDSRLTKEQIKAAEILVGFDIECYGVDEVITHAEVKQKIIDKRLTPIGSYDPLVCPGKGTIDDIVEIRNYISSNYRIPFNEETFRKLFK